MVHKPVLVSLPVSLVMAIVRATCALPIGFRTQCLSGIRYRSMFDLLPRVTFDTFSVT